MLIYSNKIYSQWLNNSSTYYSMRNEKKFQNYFFSFIYNINLYDKNFMIWDIYDEPSNIFVMDECKKQNINNFFHNILNDVNDENLMDVKDENLIDINNENLMGIDEEVKNDINVMLCVENCNYWKYYTHYNKYGNFGNKLISIYLYNHFDRFIKTDKYIVIPIIYLQIDYFNKFFLTIKPSLYTPFYQKKFCLVCSVVKNNYNNNLETVLDKLKLIGECDYIKNIPVLRDKSCYHDITLLNILNKYKFIYVFENSITDGYITEKIFNCFFARTIPIYFGPRDKYRYFNNGCFIDIEKFNDNTLIFIKYLSENKDSYYNFLNHNIINKNFNNENYVELSNQFIQNL
jgi:hypothetical protein